MKPFVSIYEPLSVKIDGQDYQVRRLNRGAIKKLIEIQKREVASSPEEKIDICYEIGALCIDAPQDVIDNLDRKEILRLVSWINEFMGEEAKAGAAGEGEGKNPTRPGDEAPAP